MQASRAARPGLGWCLCWALLGAGSGSGPLGPIPGEAHEGQLAFPARDGRQEASAAAASAESRRARSLSGEPPDASAVRRLRDAPEEFGRAPWGSPEEPPVAAWSPDGDRGGGRGPEGQGSRAPRRRAKRGFTYPGTLWCGAGNIAASYEELGEHQETDRCCRAHDHCRHVIHPFNYKYGYRNYRWHTISHCDCDNQLKACLRAVNDTASRVVGQAFFNIIQVPCFQFAYKQQCVEPYLYMWCKNYSSVPVAVVQPPVLYEYGGEVIDGPAARWTTAATPSLPRATEAPEPPGSTARPWKVKGWKKGRKKGRKSRKGKKKKPGGRAKGRPDVGAATASPKRLAAPVVPKGVLETQAGLPELGEGDPFNAILGDDPRGGTGPWPAEGGGAAESQGRPPRKGSPGPSSPAGPLGRKRKGRGPKARGQPGSGPLRDPRAWGDLA